GHGSRGQELGTVGGSRAFGSGLLRTEPVISPWASPAPVFTSSSILLLIVGSISRHSRASILQAAHASFPRAKVTRLTRKQQRRINLRGGDRRTCRNPFATCDLQRLSCFHHGEATSGRGSSCECALGKTGSLLRSLLVFKTISDIGTSSVAVS